MKKTASRFLIVGVLALLHGGCGTLGTATDPQSKFGVYSGTKASAEGHVTQWDVPFSLVADTLLLPITVPLEIARKVGESGEQKGNAPAADVK